MATKYTFNFTDISKSSFDLFPYTSNGPVSPSDPTLIPQAVAQDTTLKLYGKGMKEYGEGIEQNLIYILENFANSTAPVNAIEGQTWYKNATSGSPLTGPELFLYSGTNWDAVILATGTSAMTGELILSGTPTNPLGAVPLQDLSGHTGDTGIHVTALQSAFLDGLTLPTLTSTEANYLIGVTSLIQTQLDARVSRFGDNMDLGANLTFSGTGEVLGLPIIPSADGAAASKRYVDDTVGAIGGDGVLTSVNWITDQGSGVVLNETTLRLSVSGGSIFTMDGISRVGHLHPATEITVIGLPAGYGPDVQTSLNYIEINKADLNSPAFTGNSSVAGNLSITAATSFIGSTTALEPTTSNQVATKNYVDSNSASALLNIQRKLELVTANIVAGTPYNILSHVLDDNKASITINGQKQYNSTHSVAQIQYDNNAVSISNTSQTGLDPSITYEFDIDIDNTGPNTIVIPSTQNVDTHGALIAYINSQLNIGSPPLSAVFDINDPINETITTWSFGATSSIVISDPGSPNTYLFAIDPTPTVIIGANFIYDITGSPIIPDELIIAGDVTATFTTGKTFTIRGSVEPVYGSYDGVYSVHDNGAVYDGTTNTTVPIGVINDSSTPQALIPAFTGAPIPAPSAFGNAHFTPLGGFTGISASTLGIDADYFETDINGNILSPSSTTDYVIFNSTILAGGTGSPPTTTLIETILI